MRGLNITEIANVYGAGGHGNDCYGSGNGSKGRGGSKHGGSRKKNGSNHGGSKQKSGSNHGGSKRNGGSRSCGW